MRHRGVQIRGRAHIRGRLRRGEAWCKGRALYRHRRPSGDAPYTHMYTRTRTHAYLKCTHASSYAIRTRPRRAICATSCRRRRRWCLVYTARRVALAGAHHLRRRRHRCRIATATTAVTAYTSFIRSFAPESCRSRARARQPPPRLTSRTQLHNTTQCTGGTRARGLCSHAAVIIV